MVTDLLFPALQGQTFTSGAKKKISAWNGHFNGLLKDFSITCRVIQKLSSLFDESIEFGIHPASLECENKKGVQTPKACLKPLADNVTVMIKLSVYRTPSLKCDSRWQCGDRVPRSTAMNQTWTCQCAPCSVQFFFIFKSAERGGIMSNDGDSQRYVQWAKGFILWMV